MSQALVALLVNVLWTMGLVGAMGTWRVAQVLAKQKRSNEFPSGSEHGSPLYWRYNRAHINSAENLPLFAAVVLVGTVVGETGSLFGDLAVFYVVARICQSIIHLSSGSVMAINMRFTFFTLQLASLVWMVVILFLR